MIDIASQLEAIHREVGKQAAGDGEVVAVLLRRTYPAQIHDVWDAITDPDRVERWFLPLSGELRPGGSFQLEGNAGGDILECAPPGLLRVTFGGPTSLVELRLSSDGANATVLELEHSVPIEMAGSGAGALYVGPGWDGALLALGLFMSGEVADDPVAAAYSPEGLEFSKRSVETWIRVVEASATASSEEISAATEMALAQFAPDG
ncbi:MAG: SRPBCC domain-containing protein [Acidimicrobiia bacterium]